MRLWQELATNDEERQVVFTVLGFGLVSISAFFLGRAKGASKRIQSINRFLLSSFCAMIVMIGSMLWLLWLMPDYELPTDPPPSIIRNVVTFVYVASISPMRFFEYNIAHKAYLGSHVVTCCLFLLTGLFWGFLVKAIFYLIALWLGSKRARPA
jgi:hypothetical protein